MTSLDLDTWSVLMPPGVSLAICVYNLLGALRVRAQKQQDPEQQESGRCVLVFLCQSVILPFMLVFLLLLSLLDDSFWDLFQSIILSKCF